MVGLKGKLRFVLYNQSVYEYWPRRYGIIYTDLCVTK